MPNTLTANGQRLFTADGVSFFRAALLRIEDGTFTPTWTRDGDFISIEEWYAMSWATLASPDGIEVGTGDVIVPRFDNPFAVFPAGSAVNTQSSDSSPSTSFTIRRPGYARVIAGTTPPYAPTPFDIVTSPRLVSSAVQLSWSPTSIVTHRNFNEGDNAKIYVHRRHIGECNITGTLTTSNATSAPASDSVSLPGTMVGPASETALIYNGVASVPIQLRNAAAGTIRVGGTFTVGAAANSHETHSLTTLIARQVGQADPSGTWYDIPPLTCTVAATQQRAPEITFIATPAEQLGFTAINDVAGTQTWTTRQPAVVASVRLDNAERIDDWFDLDLIVGGQTIPVVRQNQNVNTSQAYSIENLPPGNHVATLRDTTPWGETRIVRVRSLGVVAIPARREVTFGTESEVTNEPAIRRESTIPAFTAVRALDHSFATSREPFITTAAAPDSSRSFATQRDSTIATSSPDASTRSVDRAFTGTLATVAAISSTRVGTIRRDITFATASTLASTHLVRPQRASTIATSSTLSASLQDKAITRQSTIPTGASVRDDDRPNSYRREATFATAASVPPIHETTFEIGGLADAFATPALNNAFEFYSERSIGTAASITGSRTRATRPTGTIATSASVRGYHTSVIRRAITFATSSATSGTHTATLRRTNTIQTSAQVRPPWDLPIFYRHFNHRSIDFRTIVFAQAQRSFATERDFSLATFCDVIGVPLPDDGFRAIDFAIVAGIASPHARSTAAEYSIDTLADFVASRTTQAAAVAAIATTANVSAVIEVHRRHEVTIATGAGVSATRQVSRTAAAELRTEAGVSGTARFIRSYVFATAAGIEHARSEGGSRLIKTAAGVSGSRVTISSVEGQVQLVAVTSPRIDLRRVHTFATEAGLDNDMMIRHEVSFGTAASLELPRFEQTFRLRWTSAASSIGQLHRSLMSVQLRMSHPVRSPRISIVDASTGESIPVFVRGERSPTPGTRLKIIVQPRRDATPDEMIVTYSDAIP